jgi:hypothetical protein
MGGSGGGGGSAGEVSWPSYLETWHDWLLTSGQNAATIANPYTGLSALDPSGFVSQIQAAVLNFGNALNTTNPWNEWNNIINTSINRYTIIKGDNPEWHEVEPRSYDYIDDFWAAISSLIISPTDIDTNWDVPTPEAVINIPDNWTDPEYDAIDNIAADWTDPSPNAPDDIDTNLASSATISAAVTAYGTRLDDTISSDVVPRFQAGMRDINAVQSSAFVIGRAVIEGMRDRDVANFDADLTTKLTAQQDQLLGQAFMQDDKILAANVDSENKAMTQGYLQIDKMNAESTNDKNKVSAQAYLEQDKILASSVMDKNKAIAQAYTQADKLRVADTNDKSKLKAQALIQGDKLYFDAYKARNLIEAEMTRHNTAMVYQDADLFWKTLHQAETLYGQWASATVDSARIKYVMQKEYIDKDNEYDINGANWSMEMANKFGNLMASISGGTAYTPGPTPAQNALGGAFSGAAIGARVSGGSAAGAGAGAILGGIGAYLMGR